MKKEIILMSNAINEIGTSIYDNRGRLFAIIADLVSDEKLRKLLTISVKEGLTHKLYKLFLKGVSIKGVEISSLKSQLKDETFLEIYAIDKIFEFWLSVIWKDDFLLLIPIKRDDKWGFCNREKELIIPFEYDYVLPFSEGLSAVKIGDKWGYINKSGSLSIPAFFKYANSFVNGIAGVIINTHLWAYINKKGEYVIEPFSTNNNDKENWLNDGLVRFFDNQMNKYGFINLNNEKIIDCIFDEITSFSDGIAILGNVYKPRGYINKKGEIIKLINFEYAFPFSNARGLIKVNGNYGFADKNGNIVIDPVFEDAKSFSDGLAAVCKNGKWGFIDINGNVKIQYIYNSVESFSEERAFVLKKSGWGFIDKEGNEYTSFDYFNYKSLGWSMEDHGFLGSQMHRFKDGLAIVSRFIDSKDLTRLLYGEKESKFGFVDIWGNEVLECKYPPVDGHFENELAKIGYTYNGGWSYSFFGYIDRDGCTYGFDLKRQNDEEDYYPDYLLED